jgi:hypothetical protein
VSADDIVWGAAQVVSRAFGVAAAAPGERASLALAPWIDLVNHAPGWGKPDGWFGTRGRVEDGSSSSSSGDSSSGDDEEGSVGRVEACMAVWLSREGGPVALAPGEEFLVSYGDNQTASPLSAYLNLGFVPHELHAQLA